MGGHSVPLRRKSGQARDRGLVTIDILSDDALEIIFRFYVNLPWGSSWRTPVHVCRRWRYLMFASPHRLKVRLEYHGHGPISEALGTWPVLPVVLKSADTPPGNFHYSKSDQRWENRLAALESEHYTRLCGIYIYKLPSSRWERFTAAMQKPFPELTHLGISVDADHVIPVVPDSFLGGSAPHLQELALGGLSFPSMTKLLLSANSLVTLILLDIPDSGYISPNAMATALAVMTRLETLDFRFRSPRRPNPASRPLPPPTRFVLPAFNRFTFRGVYEYLEDLLARIDAPLLYDLYIHFSMGVNFDVPQLHRLIRHAGPFDRAHVSIDHHSIQLTLSPKTGLVNHRWPIDLYIWCGGLEQQLSSLAQVCSSLSPLISTLEELQILEYRNLILSHQQDDTENARWLGLLRPFTALKNLYLTHGVAERVFGALHDLSGESATEVLPALRNLFVQGPRSLQPVKEVLMSFVAARQLSGHPVAIDHWGSKEERQHICYLPPRQYSDLRFS